MTRDLMAQDSILEAVRRVYSSIPTGAGRATATRFYDTEELASLPAPAVDWSLGVADPVRHAGLSRGDRVLDVGCGGGIDMILAARAVGPTGRVIGLDLLPEMCERARAASNAAGVGDWCELRQGRMEHLPLDDACVDVVVSNGVINLSPRKSRALAEIGRVLRPGGRLCVADLTVDGDLPPDLLTSETAWAGCIAGALSEAVLVKKLTSAGFTDIEIFGHVPLGIDDIALYPLFTPDVIDAMRASVADGQRESVCVSLMVRARRPGSTTKTADRRKP